MKRRVRRTLTIIETLEDPEGSEIKTTESFCMSSNLSEREREEERKASERQAQIKRLWMNTIDQIDTTKEIEEKKANLDAQRGYLSEEERNNIPDLFDDQEEELAPSWYE